MRPNPKSEARDLKQMRSSRFEVRKPTRSGTVPRSFVLWILHLFRVSYFEPRVFLLWAFVPGTLLLDGCVSQPQKLQICPGKATAAEALQTLAARAERAVELRANGQAVLTYHVPDQNRVERHNVPMELRFAPPGDIYVQGSVGVDGRAVIMGSNGDEFWLALRPREISSYYLGQWDQVGDFEGLIMSPRVMLEAMGLVTEPAAAPNEALWTLNRQGPYDVLTRRDEIGRVVKRVSIYACDYTVRKIEYFDRRGKAAAVAQLGDYKPVAEGFEVPTRINIVSTNAQGRKDSIVMDLRSPRQTQFNSRQREFLFNPPDAAGYEHVYHLEAGHWVPQ
jgi:hypothetical protein